MRSANSAFADAVPRMTREATRATTTLAARFATRNQLSVSMSPCVRYASTSTASIRVELAALFSHEPLQFVEQRTVLLGHRVDERGQHGVLDLLLGCDGAVDERTAHLTSVQQTFLEEPVHRRHHCRIGDRRAQLFACVSYTDLGALPRQAHHAALERAERNFEEFPRRFEPPEQKLHRSHPRGVRR